MPTSSRTILVCSRASSSGALLFGVGRGLPAPSEPNRTGQTDNPRADQWNCPAATGPQDATMSRPGRKWECGKC